MGLNQVVRAVCGQVVKAEIWFLVMLGVRDDLHVLVGAAGRVLVVRSSKLLTVIVCLAPVLQEPPSESFHSVLMFIL